jgi:hypothetical protein
MWSGMPILPTSWSGAARRISSTSRRRSRAPFGEQRREHPDPLGVAPGRVVAVLGGGGEALEHVEARRLELDRPLAHHLLEVVGVVAQLRLQVAGAQQVGDPQPDLLLAERLGEEVLGAARQRLALGLGLTSAVRTRTGRNSSSGVAAITASITSGPTGAACAGRCRQVEGAPLAASASRHLHRLLGLGGQVVTSA